jgi:arylsulfatase A-like enzyme
MTDPLRLTTRQRPGLLAGLLTGMAAPMINRLSSAAAAGQPDIIVLILNDARDGDQAALPQTLSRLADSGTVFPNFFLTTPLCNPSRASILTGLYPHNHGAYDNRNGPHGGWEGFAAQGNRGRTTGVILQAAGYRTAAIGQYLNGEQPGQGMEPGWHIGPVARRRRKKKGKKKGKGGKPRRLRAQDFANEARRGGKKGKGKKRRHPGGGTGDWGLVSAAAGIIAETSVDQPLYLHVGFGTPHAPVIPTPPYAGQYAGERIDRDPSFNEADVGDKPKYIRDLNRLSGGDEGWLDNLHRGRREVLLALDDGIVSIWNALQARGRLDNTYVFLMTDNGHLIGHHRFYGKIAPYDGSARMPLFAFGPEFGQGITDPRLVGNIDIAPTLAEVASANPPAMDGRSLLSPHQRQEILIESLGQGLQSMDWPGPRTGIPRYSAARTADHLYVEYQGGERELYDYVQDPYEVQNLLAGTPSPEANALAVGLASRLNALRNCDGAACS